MEGTTDDVAIFPTSTADCENLCAHPWFWLILTHLYSPQSDAFQFFFTSHECIFSPARPTTRDHTRGVGWARHPLQCTRVRRMTEVCLCRRESPAHLLEVSTKRLHRNRRKWCRQYVGHTPHRKLHRHLFSAGQASNETSD